MTGPCAETLNSTEQLMYERYAAAAREREQELCCPVEYQCGDASIVPEEIMEKDYGCGDPTPYVLPGETVLDLGSGGGKVCYLLANVVGRDGRVIGVDCNQEMLALARKYQRQVADRLGFANVEFRHGRIQDLRLNLDLLAQEIAERPPLDAASWQSLRKVEEQTRLEHATWHSLSQIEDQLRRARPMVSDDSIDCVVSNCVLNLVRQSDRQQLFAEIFRVLKRGGRAAISDIVCDEDVNENLRRDPKLWSGCVSGAFREDKFIEAFEQAGFHGIEIVKRQHEPWRVIEGIEFRSMTVVAYKGKQGPCLERNQAVIYRGPFREARDDDGHVFPRGVRVAVCDKTFRLLRQPPYAAFFEAVEPRVAVPLEDARPFDCRRFVMRHPRETKGEDYDANVDAKDPCQCADGSCC